MTSTELNKVPNHLSPTDGSNGSPWQNAPSEGLNPPHGGAGGAVVPPSSIDLGKLGGGVNPFLSLPDKDSSVDYKKGYVMRKCCVDPSGKKTKVGKRSWKMYFLCLRDMVLYCFKDSKSLGQVWPLTQFFLLPFC